MTNNPDIAKIAAGLLIMERERLTGWGGPAGAAYNVISEDLCEAGLLDRNWNLTGLGRQVATHLKGNEHG